MNAARIERAQALFQSPRMQATGRVLRWAFFAGVLGWLVLKVRAIGWQAVWNALPTTPWFYVLFVVMFLALPLSETVIFRRILGRPLPGALPVFIRKRVFNSAFVGYSGELYLFVWAKGRLGIAGKTMLLALKDNAILSAIASGLVTSALLATFVGTGQVRWIAHWLDSAAGLLIATALIALFLVPLAVRLRRQILSIRLRTAGAVLGIHILRIVAVVLLQAAQWSVALPGQAWSTWLVFLTLQMVISRLPFVPNRDLLFLSAGLELSHAIDGPRAAMAGLLLAGGALTQGSNLLFFVLTSFAKKPGEPTVAHDAAFEAEVAPQIVPPVNE